MRPIRLVLHNFAGILSGQGKDKIEIDLDKAVSKDAQIIAIAGPNGAGKTTIMDNLHPYRLMPSRAGSPSPSAFSFYEHIAGGEGSKELIWEHMGVRYQSVMRFRSTAKTKKTEAYLYVVDAAGAAAPWSDPASGAVSDGKTDTYDRAIERILGKPEVFFQAQFSAQGKEPIGSMSASDVKRLIADMIGANRSSELSGKASEVVKALKPRLSAMQDEVSRAEASIPDEGALRGSLSALDQQITQAQSQLSAMSEQSVILAGRIAAAGKNAEQVQAAKAQHAAFGVQLQEAERSHQQARARIEDQRAEQLAAAQQALASGQQGERSAAHLVLSLQADLNRHEQIAAMAPKVQAAEQAVGHLTAQLEGQRARLDELTPRLLQLEQVQSGVTTMATELASIAKDGEHLVNALAAARETASLLSQVPCQGTDLSGQCKLLSQANGAAARIPEVEVQLKSARAGYKVKNDGKAALQASLDELRASAEQAAGMRSEIARLETELVRQRALSETAASVRQAQEAIPALRERLREATDALARAQASTQSAQEQVLGVTSRIDALVAQARDDHAVRLRSLEQVRLSLPAVNAGDDVQILIAEQDALKVAIRQTEQALALRQQELAQADSRLDLAVQSRQRVAEQRLRCEALSSEIAHWVLLAKALGTDGIIAMSIDDAGPAIAQIANALLDDCYGGRFALTLVTQKETQAGIAKETFRIEVEDNDRGERKFLESMSGGEKVWINECLVRAIALYMAQVADTRSQTLFSDESDGPLDPQRKRQYMAMKRAVMERGGYDREYLITQTPELLEMCDAVIDVSSL